MDHALRPMTADDSRAVLDVFNHYVDTSFAAFPERHVGPTFTDEFLQIGKTYPVLVVESPDGDVVGFGFVRQYFPLSTVKRTGMVGYFIAPEHCGQGVGTVLLERLVREARGLRMDTLMAMVAGHNHGSIRFHLRNGFEEVGRFRAVARKFDEDVDQVWLQRFI